MALGTGILIRHAKGIDVSDGKISSAKDDVRPAVVLNDVQAADFSHLEIPHSAGIPAFVLHNLEGVSVSRAKGVSDVTLDKVSR